MHDRNKLFLISFFCLFIPFLLYQFYIPYHENEHARDCVSIGGNVTDYFVGLLNGHVSCNFNYENKTIYDSKGNIVENEARLFGISMNVFALLVFMLSLAYFLNRAKYR